MSFFPVVFPEDLSRNIRVVNPFSLYNVQFLYDKKPLFWDELLANGGTSILNLSTSCIQMAVTTASGSRVVRQTKEYFVYQPNRVRQFTGTGIFGVGQANTNQYIGVGDDNDGIFFKMQGTQFGVVVRTSTSGSPVESFTPQTSFNLDKLDGTGPSGTILDITKTQLFIIEYQWFGVGTVRFGIYSNNQINYVHQVPHSNVDSLVYMKHGNLPIRYEIVNTGIAANPLTLIQICSAVDSEGGYQPHGIKRAADSGTTAKTVGTTFVPILSVNLKPVAKIGTITPLSFSFLATAADNYEFQVSMNPTLTGASFVSLDTNSIAQIDTTATAVSGGTAIANGYSSSTQRTVVELPIATTLKIVSSISGATDTCTLSARHIGSGTTQMFASAEWLEFI